MADRQLRIAPVAAVLLLSVPVVRLSVLRPLNSLRIDPGRVVVPCRGKINQGRTGFGHIPHNARNRIRWNLRETSDRSHIARPNSSTA